VAHILSDCICEPVQKTSRADCQACVIDSLPYFPDVGLRRSLGTVAYFSYWSLMYPRCILLNMLCFAQYFKWFESGQHWQQIFDILCMEDSNSSWQRIEMGACCFPTSHRCSQLYYFCSRELDHQMVVKNTSTCIALICSLLKQLLML